MRVLAYFDAKVYRPKMGPKVDSLTKLAKVSPRVLIFFRAQK